MSDLGDLLNMHLALVRRLDEHIVATSNMLRFGAVKERDHEQGTRVDFGTDDEPELSSWVQPSERSGVERDLPQVGEQLAVLSAYGDPLQGFTFPLGHSKDKPNPASHADETVVFNRGKVRISVDNKSGVVTVKNDKVTHTITGSKITDDVDGNKTEHTKEKTEFGDGAVRHKTANIGRDHNHKGVMKGADNTEEPND